MTTGATGQLGLALPVQGELSGTWGDTVNNGITQYTNIAIAATLTLTDDGAVTLANTTGDASATNITSSLTGAGTVTAQFAIVKVTGTLTTAKVVTGPSYSKTYVVVNAATGGIVTFKASGQTGVSIAVGESAWVYYNGTDYVKIASTTSGSAGGSNTQVQYNSSGALAGSSAFTFDGAQISVNGITVGRGAGAVASNTAVGASALAANTTGYENIAVGYQALNANQNGYDNVAIGRNSMLLNVSGANNTAVGDASLRANTGNFNSGFGSNALYSNTSGSNNVAVGYQSLLSNTTASANTAVGYQALYSNTTSGTNTAVGYQASYSVTGAYNTTLGHTAGYAITTGTENVSIGQGSMALGAGVTGDYNTTVGTSSTRNLTSGVSNTAMGQAALNATTTGSANTAIGKSALQLNTTGGFNTGLGHSALYSNTTASNNTAVGYQAGYTNSTGGRNTFLGAFSGFASNVNGLAYNLAVGYEAGYSLTTGLQNTFVGGLDSGYFVTTGSKNTILGNYTGNQGGLDIRTASNYIVLSDGDGNPRMYNNGTDWYDAAGKLRAIPQSGSAKTGSYTLATTDVGEFIEVGSGGSITVPNSTFSTGDVVSIFNNTSGNITMTMSITTAYIGGTDSDKATITLATRGVATVLFISSTVCVVNGNVS